jgi:uncharacterized protein (TIGR03083 family)
MGEVAQAYRGCRERIIDIVAGLDVRQAQVTVPTCPDWTVHDVVAHLSGNLADAVAGRLDGAPTDDLTAQQIAVRRKLSAADVIEEWNEHALVVEPLMDGAGDIARQGVADAVSHEHDIRAALGVPGARDSDAVRIGLAFAAGRLVESAGARGVSLLVRTGDGWEHGAGGAEVILTAEPFELLRAITGRRSVGQLREMEWKGDYESAIPAFWWGPLHPADTTINE